jgi:hypothetical protein
VAGHGLDELVGVAAPAELFERHPRVPGVEVRVTLVVEVVEQPRDAPELLVLSLLARVEPHRGLHAEGVLAERVGLGPLAEEPPSLFALDRHGTRT